MARFRELFHALLQQILLLSAALFVFPFLWTLDLLSTLFCCRRTPKHQAKSILITGATSGIGEALAKGYARDGVHLALTGRNRAVLDATATACRAAGAEVSTAVLDVVDEAGMRAWIREVDARKPLDLVIANAGVTEQTAKCDGAAHLERAARTLFAANVTGVFNTIFPALEGMRSRGAGQVAIVSSIAGWGAVAHFCAYAATKAAVRVFGEGLRWVLLREGVHVNVIAPGFVESPMTAVQTFAQPGIVSTDYAVRVITDGLAADVPFITFPASTAALTWLLGAFPPTIKDFLARQRWAPQVAYSRASSKRSGAGASAAGGAPAVPTAASPSAGSVAAESADLSTGTSLAASGGASLLSKAE